MEFTNNDAKVDVVLSDMYVGGKLLARVQAERRYLTIQKLKETSKENPRKDSNDEDTETSCVLKTEDSKNRRALLQSKTLSRYKQILTVQPSRKNGQDYVVSEKRVLSSENEEDVQVVKSKCDSYQVCSSYGRSNIYLLSYNTIQHLPTTLYMHSTSTLTSLMRQ
jgi:hypothetical protein